jgi:hypothetical protein
MRRRDFLISSAAFLSACTTVGGGNIPVSDIEFEKILDDIERRTFNFFWETTNPETGLTPDRYPSPSASSVAGVGFALASYPYAATRGYISTEQAKERTLVTLRFLWGLKQGPEARGNAGYKGYFYHFLDTKTGERLAKCELSSIDTALLMGGVIFAGDYWAGDNDTEAEIRKLARDLFNRVEWSFMINDKGRLSMGWHPEDGFIVSDWHGYNEAMLLYIMAMGAENHFLSSEAWGKWTETYQNSWGSYAGYEHLIFAPHFGHQYSHVFIDFKNIQDDFTHAKGIDYFENTRRATYAQREYGIKNPLGWDGYSAQNWGITACDGPIDKELEYMGQKRRFITYAGRGAGLYPDGRNTFDDGTIAPTAAIASLPFAPEIVKDVTINMYKNHGKYIYAQYGFLDSFNQSFQYDIPVQHGKVIKGFGWVDSDYLAIDQGPILLGIANYRNQFIWNILRDNAVLRRGLVKAGFKGGYLDAK